MQFQIKKNQIIRMDKELLTTENVNSVECSFTFSQEYEGLDLFAVFYRNEEDNRFVEIKDGVCMLPWELLQEEGILYVGAYGIRNTEEEVEKRMTTNAVVVRIVASLSSEAEPNAAPSPDLWEQYRMEILGYQSDAEDSAAQAAASASQAAESASQASASAMQADSSRQQTAHLAANAELDELSGRLHSNRAIFSALKEYIAELTEADRTRSWRKALSDTACGTVSGKEKIKLETYVQMTYFDRILARANTRFMMMSGGQYELKRKTEADSNRSQSGLELDVIDHYNGSERSVKTLSGGEAFKASLSLALGLSDEIQSSAGGIRLDAMFIDEGFGSLDEESLGQALRVLQELSGAGRLVAIISHVAELKEKIDRQVLVTKQKYGGSRAEIRV